MIKVLLARLQQKHRTIGYPDAPPPPLPERFRGRPVFDAAKCPEGCHECAEICPTQAIEVRGYADFVPLGASVTPMRSSEDILWTVQFRNKEIKPKRFKFPTRRGVAEGKAQPFDHFPTGDADLKSPTLMSEPAGLNNEVGPVKFDKVPTL